MKHIMIIALGAVIVASLAKLDVRSETNSRPISNPEVKSSIDVYNPDKQCDVFSSSPRPQLLGTAYEM